MDVAIEELLTQAGVSRARACALVGRSRASHYRAKGSSHLSGVFGCWRFTRPCGSRCGALCAVRSLPGCGTRIRRA